jgi:APA family basic amino acid/polyamine antiporter
LSAFPAENGTALGGAWVKAPLMGIVARLRDHLPDALGVPLQVFVGTSGALILATAAATSIAGFGRLAYSLGEHGQLPREFGRLSRRSVIAPHSIVAAATIAIALLVVTDVALTHPIFFLASLYSFGVLLAFTAAQLAVVRLRFSHPEKRRPYRVPLNIGRVPVPSLVGAGLTAVVWILAMATHEGARYGGPVWLAVGLAVYVVVRRRRGEGLTERVVSADEHVGLTEAQYSSILVPMKLGPIGEEMVATAVKLAQEAGASVWALHVVRVPMERELDQAIAEEEERAAASLAEAQLLGADHGVKVKTKTVLARSIGQAIVEQAEELSVDLIVVGSSPRWRRQSRFFSPTVEYVLKKAPAEVLVVAFPQGVLEEEEEPVFEPAEVS